MLTKLTNQQENLMVETRQKWLDKFFKENTAIDKQKFFVGIDWLYSLIKLKTPIKLILDSPLSCQLAVNLLQTRNQVVNKISGKIRDQVWNQVRDQVDDQVVNQVKSQVMNQVRDKVWNQVRYQVDDQVVDQVRDQVWNQVKSQVVDQIRAQVSDQVVNQVRSQIVNQVIDKFNNTTLQYMDFSYQGLYWIGWVSFYDYFKQIKIVESINFNKYLDYLDSGVLDPILLDTVAIGCNRPYWIKRDEQNRLHCSDGPAILWRDGYMQYFWHGVSVPEIIIEHPERITKQFIQAEKNSEVQRTIAEKLGWSKYLELVDIKLIHKWFDETTSCHYELYDFNHRLGSLQPRLLKMESPELHDGTRPFYIEPVPPESQTCQAARRWQNDPLRPGIQECNDNPELIFEVEQ